MAITLPGSVASVGGSVHTIGAIRNARLRLSAESCVRIAVVLSLDPSAYLTSLP